MVFMNTRFYRQSVNDEINNLFKFKKIYEFNKCLINVVADTEVPSIRIENHVYFKVLAHVIRSSRHCHGCRCSRTQQHKTANLFMSMCCTFYLKV